jgi:tRNA pseudouridine13 synthase
LAEWLERHYPASHLSYVRLKLNDVPVPHALTSDERHELAALVLPLPSARLKYHDEIRNAPADWPAVLRKVLDSAGIDLIQMKLKGLRRPYFSRGERPIACFPRDLSADSGPDERHEGQFKLILNFELPRGSYATLVVKRIMAAPQ